MERSPKSYGVAMCLNAVFGLVGIHHFYLGNLLHGLIDLSMFVIGVGCVWFSSDPSIFTFGYIVILIDVIHSITVMIMLIIGKCRDGQGRLLTYPGQQTP